METGEII